MTKFRIRGADRNGNLYYVTVYDGVVRLNNKSGMSSALTAITDDAMALRFALEDAVTLAMAIQVVKAQTRLTNVGPA